MKKVLAFFSILFFAATVASAQEINFETKTINYGEIEQKSNGVREFKFTNTGDAPLTITNAKGSCGCTVPVYPKEPIMPGSSNVIKVKYDTKRVGPFTKYVTLTTNDKKNTSVRLTIKGKVLAEPAATPAKPKTMFNN